MRLKALPKAGVLAAAATCATVDALADEYDDGQIKTLETQAYAKLVKKALGDGLGWS